MSEQIVITGCGIISSAGIGVEQTYNAIKREQYTLDTLKYLNTNHRDIPCAEVKYSNCELANLSSACYSATLSRSVLLGRVALLEAIDKIDISDCKRVAFVNGTTVGGMDITEQHYSEYIDDNLQKEVALQHGDGAQTFALVSFLKEKGLNVVFYDTISTACSAAANAIMLGAELLKNDLADIVIAGGTEALTKYHLNGFHSLMVLSSSACLPFDANRDGLNLGEGAAYLVLEKESIESSKKAMAVLSGYANSCDAHHQTATSDNGEGPYLSMKKAISRSGLRLSQIDYINAHGTATPNNDLTEGIALERLFGANVPKISSTKWLTGHTTSASGAIEAVICMIAIQKGIMPANVGFKQKIESLNFVPIPHTIENVEVENVLCNSFGFGGNDTTLIFSKYSDNEKYNVNECSVETNAYPPKCICNSIYIGAISAITIDKSLALNGESGYLRCVEPDYKKYISPLISRRVSPVVKRAYVTAKQTLEYANISKPDAIITATGFGCVEATENFMDSMQASSEQLLKPSHFISSTPNTIGSGIAILTGSNGYNVTHSNDLLSFENALLDSILLFCSDKDINTILLSSSDEVTPHFYKAYSNALSCCRLVGEGSVSFILQRDKSEKSIAKISSFGMVMVSASDSEQNMREAVVNELKTTLGKSSIAIDSIDLVLTDSSLIRNNPDIFSGTAIADYAAFFGDYATSSASGMYLAAKIISDITVPKEIVGDDKVTKAPKRVLLITEKYNRNFTFVLLESICSN